MSTSKVKVYDLEVFPNYFLAGFIGIEDDAEPELFEIYDVGGNEVNEAHSLIDFVSDKWLVGYNSRNYDNQLIHFLLKSGNEFLAQPAQFIAQRLFKTSTRIIEDDYSEYKWDLPFDAIDLMRVGNIDKSLKLCGVDLKWKTVQDLIRPHDKDVEPDELEAIRDYNINDLGITKSLYDELREDIVMRQELSVKYGTDLMDYADSGVADRLLEKFYAERTKLSYWDFKDSKTERNWVLLDDCISDKVMFSTQKMKDALTEIRGERLSVDSKFKKRILIGDTYYDMLKGGLHSVRQPEIFEATSDVDLIDADVRN